jgi:hypothetical protein
MRTEAIEKRLARIESRIVQIMLHLEIDPYVRMYDKFIDDKHDQPTEPNPQSRSRAKGKSRP